jgi:hypothetical protein
MIVTSFTPWRELLARAEAALTEERKAQALTEPFALLESLMQINVRKWAADRRQRRRRKLPSDGIFPIPRPAPPGVYFDATPALQARP